jgi:iron complex outermembrane recepter protein
LSTNRFNVLASLDVFKRDPILRKDRDISKTVDFRRFGPIPGFNLDGRSSFAPEGNILNANGSFSGLTVRPCAPENFTNGACRYDFNASLLTAYNGADRVSALVAGNFAITPDLLAYARYMGSTDDNHFEAHPVPDNFVLPAPDNRRYAGRFMQGGPRITDKATKFNNIDVGVDGSIGKFDVRFGVSSGKAEATNSDQNYYDRAKYDAATAAKLFDPTVTTNSQAVIDSLKISPVRFASSKLDSIDGLVSGDVMPLPGGMSRFAVGFSTWKEDLVDQPDPRQIAGTVVGSIQQSAVLADRKAHAFFGELQLPITRNLEGQLAVRYDKYDTSDATTPKVALKWKAMPELALRGSYSESFKMPTLKQLFANAGQGAINFTESQCRSLGFPAGCAGLSGFRVTGSNPGLQPEKGKNYNLGLVADLGVFSGSVDFWRIMKTNNISTLTLDSAITGGFFAFNQTLARYTVFQNLQNFAQTRNTGIDVDAQVKLKGTAIGNVTLRAATTYYTSQATRNAAGDTWAEFNGTYNTPRWRSTITGTAENGAWTSQMLVRNWAGYYDTTQSQQGFSNLVAGGLRSVEGYEEVDFSFSYSGIKNLVLTASVKNAFDRQPPFSATNATNNNFSQQGFSEIYGSRGRYYQLGAKYTFK